MEYIKWQYLVPQRSTVTLHLVHSGNELKQLLENLTTSDKETFISTVQSALSLFYANQWSLLGIDEHSQLVLQEGFGTISKYLLLFINRRKFGEGFCYANG